MTRKWVALGVTLVSGALVLSGLAPAADDEASPLHKVMEKVQVKDTLIKKGVRSKANYSKSQKDVVSAADDLVKLSKEAKPLIDDKARKTAKGMGVANPDDEWNKGMDNFTKEAETFSKLLGSSTTTFEKAKEGYRVVGKACTACHDKFRGEEE
jgi:cytochrome c556